MPSPEETLLKESESLSSASEPNDRSILHEGASPLEHNRVDDAPRQIVPLTPENIANSINTMMQMDKENRLAPSDVGNASSTSYQC
ncbi:uncharacterized protein ARMOST_05538 [Armillaria ostoyae]|uniref:Uncharacterized protein n=1 Tax=Armillaria ostoyae TaxID=47428 RepID=A0A284R0I1_ARMOS|nr:uncharacterized protein ARMOST_05538 [Armillaria ostoyae]